MVVVVFLLRKIKEETIGDLEVYMYERSLKLILKIGILSKIENDHAYL